VSTPGQDLYAADPAFVRRMHRLLGDDYAWGAPHLHGVGELAGGRVAELSMVAEAHPPRLVRFDRDGERIDRVEFHPAYREMRRLAYGAGIVGLAYDEQAHPGGGRAPHALTFGMGYVFAQAEQGLYCPICMTDGAARLVERHGSEALRERWIPRLAGTSPEDLAEGAMWLTERQGGSDVGANVARAVDAGDGTWQLYGDKWFCSNLGAEVMMVLARPEGADGGTRGLGLFLVPLHKGDGSRNEVRFHRLKDKLGTRSMPTGEATLEGARAWMLAGPGAGFKAMADMLNLSRLYNAVASCACMRRATFEALEHARRRTAFGRTLEEHPLHREVLADMVVETEAATALVFEGVRRLDRVDAGSTDPDDGAMLRALTPLVKMHTAKRAVAVASEAVEALGGNGYVEEFPTARLLRDAQVLPIWEGTTNILSLDLLLRAVGREDALAPMGRFLEAQLAAAAARPELEEAASLTEVGFHALREGMGDALTLGPEPDVRLARGFASRLARLLESAILLGEAAADLAAGDARAQAVALRHAARFVVMPDDAGQRPAPALDEPTWQALSRGAELAYAPS
jgi:alkylation response protein AidB-like acyl-CoA dehydrogenase